MSEWIWLLLGGPIVALIISRLTRVPHRPKLLHTPYARPGILTFPQIYVNFPFLLVLHTILLFYYTCCTFTGPWHYLKQATARLWLSWKMVRHPRVLNVFDLTSKKYEKIGLVSTELEKVWELPHELKNREVSNICYISYK